MEWISVKDRLPKEGKPVVVIANVNTMYGIQKHIFLVSLIDNDKGLNWYAECHEGSPDFSFEDALYWYPIPEPPKD